MRKWLTRCAMAATLIGVVLLEVVHQLHAPPISVGRALPQGRVNPQLVIEDDTAVFLAPDGSLWVWGGTQRSLTNLLPQPTISQVPLRLSSDTDWTQIACGPEHNVALKKDASLWAWGRNDEGEVGQGNFANHYGTPTRIGTETNWTKISAGWGYTLALKSDNSLWAWGDNSWAQLGDGTRINRSVPTRIGTNRDWLTISASYYHSYALKSTGLIWGWGGTPGAGTLAGLFNSSIINKSPFGGTREGGASLEPTIIESGRRWLDLTALSMNFLVLKTDGTLWLKGPDANRLASDAASRLPAPNAITQIGSENDWTDCFFGYLSFFAHKKDGSWWVSGQNLHGELGFGTNVIGVASPTRLPFEVDPWAFGSGAGTTLLLGKDGKLWTWGKRLGAGKPSAARQKFEAFVAPAVKRFPSLGFLIKSDIDRTPHLLWELPTEVRRSLGREPQRFTNNFTY